MVANNVLKTPFDFYRHVESIKRAILDVINTYQDFGESFDPDKIEMPIHPQMNGDWRVNIRNDGKILMSFTVDVEQMNTLLSSHKDSLYSIFNLWYINFMKNSAFKTDITSIQDAIRLLNRFKITPLEYGAIAEVKQYERQRGKIALTLESRGR